MGKDIFFLCSGVWGVEVFWPDNFRLGGRIHDFGLGANIRGNPAGHQTDGESDGGYMDIRTGAAIIMGGQPRGEPQIHTYMDKTIWETIQFYIRPICIRTTG